MLAAAIVVLREDSVVIEVTRGSLTIRTSGTALRSGKKANKSPFAMINQAALSKHLLYRPV
jgi:hypothetical protein